METCFQDFESNFNFQDPSLLPYVYFGIDFGDELVPTQYSMAPYAAFAPPSQSSDSAPLKPILADSMKYQNPPPANVATVKKRKTLETVVIVDQPKAVATEKTASAEDTTPATQKKATLPRPCSVCKVSQLMC